MSAPDRLAEARILWQMLRGQRRDGDLRQRLEAFYAPQAAHYDAFRARLLHGRRELIQMLAPPRRARIVELGCGTGANLAFFGERLAQVARIDLVDICPSLLAEARRRASRFGHVRVIEADACTYNPGEPVDCVFFAYSLTMIPDWRAALENAISMLRPGGRLGIVDFHLPPGGGAANAFWRRWFAHDGVHLSTQHLPALRQLLPAHVLREDRGTLPYLPGLRVPYYRFVGWRP